MKIYSDYDFYLNEYISGRTPKIPRGDFGFWSMQASAEIRRHTFGCADSMEQIPEEVKMCCCEIAEKLYQFESVKNENGMILQSYSNDGQSGTYKMDEMSESAVNSSISQIIRKWLEDTGLLYCGVM